jgi:MFS family permease
MTALLVDDEVRERRRLRRRLTPLFVAVFLSGLALWVPIEKLFMTEIGFDAASIGVMAAIYAVAVPIFEVPSGILADRWSRRGVLLLAVVAYAISVTIGGLSQNVATYLVSAMFLGIYFAMQSGTLDSVVYDTVLEETGDSDTFERTIGRVRLVESVALMTSALAGAGIAQFAPLPATYFLTIIPLIGAFMALLRFREPRLHKAEEPEPLRRQLLTTYRTILQRGRLRAVVALIVVSALLMQAMLEFGPLWLVALAVPAILYGPHWAGLTAALGLGALLGSQRWLTRRWVSVLLAVLAVGSCIVLALSRSPILVVAAQVLLTLVVVAISIPATRRLHDAVSSSVRASIASGVGALTWLAFVPFALLIGFVSKGAGVENAGWLLAAVALIAGVLIVAVLPAAVPHPVQSVPLSVPAFSADRFLPADDPDWPGHWAQPPADWDKARVVLDGDESALSVVRATITAMPAELRQVITLRDVQGHSATTVQQALGIDAAQERDLLQQARGLVRDRLEQFVEGGRG